MKQSVGANIIFPFDKKKNLKKKESNYRLLLSLYFCCYCLFVWLPSNFVIFRVLSIISTYTTLLQLKGSLMRSYVEGDHRTSILA